MRCHKEDVPLAFCEVTHHDDPKRPWLNGTWKWRLLAVDGRLLADGEGCASPLAAIEAARTCLQRDFAGGRSTVGSG